MGNNKIKLLDLIAEQFSVSKSEIKMEDGPGDLPGWDSIGQLQLILKVEQSYGITLSVDDVMSINNILDIEKIVTKHNMPEEQETEAVKKSTIVVQSPKISVKKGYIPIRLPRNIYQEFEALSILNESFDNKKIVIITSDTLHGNIFFEQAFLALNTDNDVVHVKKYGKEPTEDEIEKIAEQLKANTPDLIITIGGGSIIDSGKLSWLLYENPEIVLHNVDKNTRIPRLRKLANFVAIPSTFGSGAEASSAAAFTKNNENKKSIVVSDEFMPDYVFLDSKMGNSLTKNVIFSSAFDAITHAIEGYVSLADNTFMKPLAVSSISTIIDALKDIFEKGVSPSNLEKLCYSSFWAGVVQNHCSVGATHAFAHNISDPSVSHGLANAVFLVPVMKMNASKTDVYKKLVKEVGFNNLDMLTVELSSLIYQSKIINKSDFAALSQDQDSIVRGAMEDITFRTNPVLLNEVDMNEILKQTIQFINE